MKITGHLKRPWGIWGYHDVKEKEGKIKREEEGRKKKVEGREGRREEGWKEQGGERGREE